MKDTKYFSKKSIELRQRAEKIAQEKATDINTKLLSSDEIQQLLHELQVHQIELEMQNDELKRVQEELEASRQKFFDLYNRAPVGYFNINDKGLILEVNLAGAYMLGIERKHLIKKPITLFISKDDQDIYYFHRKKLYETTEQQVCDLRMMRSTGNFFWAHLEENISYDAISSETVYRLVVSDITGYKEADEAMRISEQHYRLLYDSMLQGVAYQDVDGKVISLNPMAEQILGKTSEELLGSTSINEGHDSIHEDGSPFPGLEHPSMVALKTGQKVKDVVMGVYNPRLKEYRWISIDAVPMFRPGEIKPYQVYTLFNDITDRKQMEMNLQETTDYLENLINYANAPIIVWDTRHKITRFNRAFEHLTGRKAVDVIGKSLKILFAPDNLKSSMKLIRKATGGERWDVIEIPIVNIDGSEKIVLWNSATIFAADGRTLLATIAQGQDITERKRAEVEIQDLNLSLEQKVILRTEELEKMEKRYRVLYESSQDAILLLTPDGRFFAGNPSAIKLFGCKNEKEFTAYNTADFLPEFQPDGSLSAQKGREMLKIALKKGSIYFEYFYKRIDDSLFPASVLLTRVEIDDKICLQATIRDISAQKAYEEALKQSEEKFRTVSSMAPDAIIMVDSNGNITFWNPAAQNIFGYSSEEILGKQVHDILAPKHLSDKYHEKALVFQRTGTGDAIGRIQEMTAIRKDGTEFPIGISLAAFKKGEEWMAVASIQEITARKRIENELHVYHEHLEQLVFERTAALQKEVTEHRKAEETITSAARHWRTTFDSLMDVVCLLDTRHRIISCNKATLAFLGKDYSDILGYPYWELIHGAAAPTEECSVVRMEKSLKHESVDIQVGDGYFSETAEPVFDEAGALRSIVLIIRDITQIKKAQEEKTRLQDKR